MPTRCLHDLAVHVPSDTPEGMQRAYQRRRPSNTLKTCASSTKGRGASVKRRDTFSVRAPGGQADNVASGLSK